MIELLRLDGHPCWINPETLLMVESTPDTVIRLTNGDKLVVKNTVDNVREQFVAYQQAIRQSAGGHGAFLG